MLILKPQPAQLFIFDKAFSNHFKITIRYAHPMHGLHLINPGSTGVSLHCFVKEDRHFIVLVNFSQIYNLLFMYRLSRSFYFIIKIIAVWCFQPHGYSKKTRLHKLCNISQHSACFLYLYCKIYLIIGWHNRAITKFKLGGNLGIINVFWYNQRYLTRVTRESTSTE